MGFFDSIIGAVGTMIETAAAEQEKRDNFKANITNEVIKLNNIISDGIYRGYISKEWAQDLIDGIINSLKSPSRVFTVKYKNYNELRFYTASDAQKFLLSEGWRPINDAYTKDNMICQIVLTCNDNTIRYKLYVF